MELNRIKLLTVYSRDISENDSGAARTTIGLLNYLSEREVFECYTSFKIIKGATTHIKQLAHENISKQFLRKLISVIHPDIILVPEGYLLTSLVKESMLGYHCYLVSAMHNMPGFEKIRLHILLLESMIYNKSYIKRIRALLAFLFFPVFFVGYTQHIKYRIQKSYNNSSKFVLLSERYFSDFSKIYNIFDSAKLVAIENPLSFDETANSNILKDKKKQILVVSRLDEQQKQLSTVLKVWKYLNRKYLDWELHIVGTGRSLKFYKSLVSLWRLDRVIFHGMQPSKEYYKSASIFLMTSAYEGWGITITEAQQFGCVPVVMNSFLALSDIIVDGSNGLITPPKNIEKFINAVEKLMSDTPYREKLANESIESTKRFTKEIVYEKWVALFMSLMKEKKASI